MTRSRPAPAASPRLSDPVNRLRGVGSQLAARLARLDILCVRDLLFHLPARYEDRTRITPIGSLRPGASAVIEGTVLAADVVFGRRRSFLCRVQDSSGIVSVRLFHFSAAQRHQLEPGARVRCFGEARSGVTGLELYHPEYRVIGSIAPPLADRLTPVYPVTEGLSQQRLRSLCNLALGLLDRASSNTAATSDDLEPDIVAALKLLHGPTPEVSLAALEAGRHPAQQRLALDELLAHQLSLLQARRRMQERAARPLPMQDDLLKRFRAALPFPLTRAQDRVIGELVADLGRAVPMLRLLQGDVGSGKTVVAAAAALIAAGSHAQTALMAPTELLAEQHARTLGPWLASLGLTTALVTGRQRAAQRRQQQELIASGAATLAIGTHALFQGGVDFQDLVLVIIDEQHRFGVHQRLALRAKGEQTGQVPHQLVMTATPIPRTLAMSAYADLELSVLDELPPGRKPVSTVAIGQERRLEVIERVSAACRDGRQAYWVCTLIEETEALEAQAAEDTAKLLGEELQDLRIGLVHGRLKGNEKASVMAEFEAGTIDLLVATTVIEVGVNVPNASLMVIENAERLGLAQLHQLRGRVGRGSTGSHCVLLYQPPLSQTGRERLSVMRASNDGFVIAEKDLELRGPGELLGTRQTGLVDLRVADLVRDQDLLPEVQARAQNLLSEDPAKAQRIVERWLGSRTQYAHA